MSKHQKLLNYLEKGNAVTAKQIQGTFGIKSPSRAIHYLREKGNCIYANHATLADGTESVKYRIGKPSKRMVALANALVGSSVFTTTN
jgi:hypothetical protein